MMTKKDPKNKSVKNLHEIARVYGYCEEVIRCGNDMAHLLISKPFYVSPYPDRVISEKRLYKYVKKIFDKE